MFDHGLNFQVFAGFFPMREIFPLCSLITVNRSSLVDCVVWSSCSVSVKRKAATTICKPWIDTCFKKLMDCCVRILPNFSVMFHWFPLGMNTVWFLTSGICIFVISSAFELISFSFKQWPFADIGFFVRDFYSMLCSFLVLTIMVGGLLNEMQPLVRLWLLSRMRRMGVCSQHPSLSGFPSWCPVWIDSLYILWLLSRHIPVIRVLSRIW